MRMLSQRIISTNLSPCAKQTCCIDNYNGFQNTNSYHSGHHRKNTRTFFSPTQGKAFRMFIKSTCIRSNNSYKLCRMPMSSIQELADNVIFFTDKSFYQLSEPPTVLPLKAGYALKLNYVSE